MSKFKYICPYCRKAYTTVVFVNRECGDWDRFEIFDFTTEGMVDYNIEILECTDIISDWIQCPTCGTELPENIKEQVMNEYEKVRE